MRYIYSIGTLCIICILSTGCANKTILDYVVDRYCAKDEDERTLIKVLLNAENDYCVDVKCKGDMGPSFCYADESAVASNAVYQ